MKNVIGSFIAMLFVLFVAVVGWQYMPTSAAMVSSIMDKANGGSSQVFSTPSPLQKKFDVQGPPTISPQFIDQVLANAHSPAAGLGQQLYTDSLNYGIDDAYALAFFHHESSYGLTGVARVTKSLGNIRCSFGYQCYQGYRAYKTWEAGFIDWYYLIKDGYVQGNITRALVGHVCTTVSQIIPVYAPSSDHNYVPGYIKAVETDVTTWRSQQ